jgi:hypothetical protein
VAWWADASQAASAAFTAVAAGAAWAAVNQGRRLWRSNLDPYVHAELVTNNRSGTTEMSIMNVGRGVAKGVMYALAVPGVGKAVGHLDNGFMSSGATAHVHTELPRSDDPKGLVIYRTVEDTVWLMTAAGSSTGPRRRLSKGGSGWWRRSRRVIVPEEACAECSPTVPLDGLPAVSQQVTGPSVG